MKIMLCHCFKDISISVWSQTSTICSKLVSLRNVDTSLLELKFDQHFIRIWKYHLQVFKWTILWALSGHISGFNFCSSLNFLQTFFLPSNFNCLARYLHGFWILTLYLNDALSVSFISWHLLWVSNGSSHWKCQQLGKPLFRICTYDTSSYYFSS